MPSLATCAANEVIRLWIPGARDAGGDYPLRMRFVCLLRECKAKVGPLRAVREPPRFRHAGPVRLEPR